MLQWVEKVWRPSVAQFYCSHLLLDCCTSHLKTVVKAAFNDCNMEVDFIPKGYTCKVQPMDVGINKPVKNYTNHQFEEWLIANNGKNPRRQEIAWWIWNGWSQQIETIVQNAWSGSGIDLLKNAADCCNNVIKDSLDRSDLLSVDSDSDFLDITGIANN
jgi:DDE superfamily endonuclease